MTAPRTPHLLLTLSLAACTLNLPDQGGSTSTTTTTTTSDGQSETGIATAADTGSTTTPTPTSTSPSDSTGMTSEPGTSVTTGSGFVVEPDGGGIVDPCDPFAQDCPEGQKCTWWNGGNGTTWESTRCVEVARDPALVGEPCVAEGGGVSGVDNCELGAMCFEVDDNGDGTCVAFCGGNELDLTCAAGTSCAISASGFALCIDICDPLAQDCEAGDACIPHHSGSYFCVIDISGAEGQLHDPCEFANACDPGLFCVSSQAASECDQTITGCCQPFCDLDMPGTCTGADQMCRPVFDPQPAGFENVGLCSVMP
jgi:hypothetical protein